MLARLTMKARSFAARLSGSWRLANAVLACSILVVLVVAVSSQFNHPERHGFDLRNRIVGARLMDVGMDPYRQFEFYANGHTPIPAWADPVVPCLSGIQSATTVPPPGLRLYQLMDSGSWTFLVRFWQDVNWFLLGAVLIGFGLTAQTPGGRIVAAIVLGPALVASHSSWSHNNVVQLYIFIGALFSLDVLLILRGRAAWAGWACGLAAIFRPQLVVVLPVFWLLGHRRAAMQGGVVAILLLGGSYMAEAPLWASFMRTTDQWAAYTINTQKDDHATAIAEKRSADCYAKNSATSAMALKDGYDFQPPHFPKKAGLNGQKANSHHGFGLQKWTLSTVFGDHWHLSAAVILTVIAVLLMALAWTIRRRNGGVLVEALILSAVPLLCETANPVTHSYVAMANVALFGVACLAVGDKCHRSVLVALIGCFWILIISGNPQFGILMETVVFLICLLAVFPRRDARIPRLAKS